MMEFFRVCAMLSCPMSVSNESGRYFLADTMYTYILANVAKYFYSFTQRTDIA